MSDTCPNCERQCQIDHRKCGFCDNDLGFPNVRYASRVHEKEALAERYRRARSAAECTGAGAEFERLEALASASRVVINRNIRQVSHWLYSENRLYQSFFKRRRNGVPYQEDDFNLQRISAENMVSPIFFEEINYAAITLDGLGMTYYGEYTILLRDVAIHHRTTVFEENPFNFAQRHNIISGQTCPLGYRALWEQRGTLVCAKLGSRLAGGEADGDLAALVMTPDRDLAECDFVEAHIHGDVFVECIDSITGPVPRLRPDRVAWGRMRMDFARIGVVLEQNP